MRRRVGRIGLVAASIAIAYLLALRLPAAAEGGPGSGHCLPTDPSCTVIITDPGDPGGPGSGSPTTGNSDGPTAPADNDCHNTDPTQGCNPCPNDGSTPKDPGACAAFGHNLFCSQLSPTGYDAAAWQQVLQLYNCAANTFTPVNPAVLAQEALATIHFPKPSGDRSPRQTLSYQGYPFTYVNLWTYYWTDPAWWHALSATASLRGVSATVMAKPVELDFDPGDGGSPVSCAGPGRPWVKADGNAPPAGGACAYQYVKVSSGPITSRQTIVWQITWTGTGGTGDELPSLSTSTPGQLQVLQVQTVTR
jgi:hypothetical protein